MLRTYDAAPAATHLLINPTEQEVEQEQERLRLHPLIVEDILGPRRRPRFMRFDGRVWLSLWDADDGGQDPTETEIMLVFDRESLLVVQRGPARALRDLAPHLGAGPDDASPSVMARIHRILKAVVDDIVAAGAGIEAKLDEVETDVFDPKATEDYARIYELRKRIGRIDRVASGIAEALRDADSALHTATADEQWLRTCFDHVRSDAEGAAALTRHEHSALDAVVASHENNVATRQNQDMRTISAVAALLAVPTVVAGFYGMNFDNLPWLKLEYGWLLVTALIVVLDVAVLVFFHWRGWIGASDDEKGRIHERSGGDRSV